MHYKNGREAKDGDPVIGVDTNGKPVAGILVCSYPDSTTCNGNVIPNNVVNQSPLVTIGECCHADDVVLPEADTKAQE